MKEDYNEEEANDRMNIIGQNGNTGEHYNDHHLDVDEFWEAPSSPCSNHSKEEESEPDKAPVIRVVKYYADWCGPCRSYAPVFEEWSQDQTIDIISIDVNKGWETARVFGITSIPATVFIRQDNTFDIAIGARSIEQLNNHTNG